MDNKNLSKTPVEIVETPATVPVTPVAEGEGVAQSFLAQELKAARSSLRITQAVSLLLVVLTAGYVGYMTWQVRNYARPEIAAEVANGIISERVDLYGQQAADSFKQQIPQLISALPDQAIAAAPELRQNLVAQVESQLGNYAEQNSQKLGANIDEFLEKNKDQVGAILKDGQDKKTVEELGPELESQFSQFLQEKPEGGESAQQQIDKSLEVLQSMKKRLDRLASGQNLTPDERKTRLAIAIIGQTVSRDTKGNDGKTLIEEAGKNLRDQVGKLGSPNLSGDDGLDDGSAATNSATANSTTP